MRKNLEYRYENSEFLQKYIARTRFTDVRWEFQNRDGHVFIVKGYGVLTGVRGTKEKATRPQLALLDDLLTDEGAKSKTVMQTVEDTVYKAINFALNPKKKKIIWNGTPFNKNDPMYKAAESGAWHTSVYPVCNEFPCSREEFTGAWEERFDYDYVREQYDTAVKTGTINAFNQELMLKVMSQDNRLVLDEDIVWYQSSTVKLNPEAFNFYITTDFATSENSSADNSAGAIWAYTNKGQWLLVDGYIAKQLMDKNVDWLFDSVTNYSENMQEVGIEVSGQQGGFIPWLYREMTARNIYFNLATSQNSNKPGIRPVIRKLERFKVVVPLFKAKQIWLPEDMKDTPFVQEILEELRYATVDGLKSRRDDCIDLISMLSELKPWKPTQHSVKQHDGVWELDIDDDIESGLSSYIV